MAYTKKIAIVRRYNKSIASLKKEVAKIGFTYSSSKPDIVISVGGDGTFFVAERKYPGIPKIMVRESQVCEKCNKGTLFDILLRYSKGYYTLHTYFKLEASVKRKNRKHTKSLACNDVMIRNKILTHALRFSLIINKRLVYKEIIGDGLVISSPFGAGAYFKSITHASFKKGIGIAFNNTTKNYKSIIAKEKDIILVHLLREKADLGFDNNPHTYTLNKGDSIVIKKSKNTAHLIVVR